MKSIILGKDRHGKNVEIDIETLIRTRLLIQANSGGGKSFLIRRICEQLFGHIPVLIIDPEGEFATLREKFGYVLVGKGGETPADPRSAKLVAHKLLELRASAVIDLYEMNPGARHNYVKLFSEAMIDAPKNLWRPTIIIFDEAHTWAPEKGAGDSEASDAVTAFPTRGRKRRFCSVFATQRLGKLRKDASAELLNRLVGPTFEDVDLKRAAELLSIPGDERRAFDAEMRILEPGNFYAFGRAICKERTMLKVGPVETSHEIENARYGSEAPPTPDKIKALLPQLKDLPKQAEETARTEAQLRQELRTLKAENQQLKAAKPLPTAAKTEIKEVSIFTEEDRLAIIDGREEIFKAVDHLEDVMPDIKNLADVHKDLLEFNSEIRKVSEQFDRLLKLSAQSQRAAGKPSESLKTPVAAAIRRPVPQISIPRSTPCYPPPKNNGESSLGAPEIKLLAVLHQYPDGIDAGKLALLAGRQFNGTMRNLLATLRTAGCMMGENTGVMRITEVGETYGPFDDPPTGEALIEWWRNHRAFGNPERELFDALRAHPEGLTAEELAHATNRQFNGTMRNLLATLRTAGVLVGRNTERMYLIPELLT